METGHLQDWLHRSMICLPLILQAPESSLFIPLSREPLSTQAQSSVRLACLLKVGKHKNSCNNDLLHVWRMIGIQIVLSASCTNHVELVTHAPYMDHPIDFNQWALFYFHTVKMICRSVNVTQWLLQMDTRIPSKYRRSAKFCSSISIPTSSYLGKITLILCFLFLIQQIWEWGFQPLTSKG